MAILEWLTTSNSEMGLWLAGVAACAGLTLAWRWWFARQSLRNRALQVLGHTKPSKPSLATSLRFASIFIVTILAVVVLTPAAPGAGDLERASEEPARLPAEVTPVALVVVELHSDGATIFVHGDTVEIRLVAGVATPTVTVTDSQVGVEPIGPVGLATPPANDTPVGME